LTDIIIRLGRIRAYLFPVSLKGIFFMKYFYDAEEVDIDLEYADETEEYLSREGLIVDSR